MQVLKEFLIFLLSSRRRIVHIRKVKKTDAKPDVTQAPTETMLRHRIVLVVTYVMSLVLLSSLIGIILFLILSPDKGAPVILHDMFFGTLGYFGGAFVNFLKVREE